MKTIKRTQVIKATLMSVFLLLSVVGCGEQNRSQVVSRISGNSDSQNSVKESGDKDYIGGYFKGAIVDLSSQSYFQRAVDNIVSSFVVNLNDFGKVSSSPDEETGVRFNGSVNLSSGFDSDKSYNLENLSTRGSSFALFIRDSKAIEEGYDYSGFEIKNFKMDRGKIRGKSVSIRFENELLIVDLEGEYDRTHFYGKAYYTVKADTKKDGRLGTFYINVCDFFNC